MNTPSESNGFSHKWIKLQNKIISKFKMKKLFLFAPFLSADDGHNEDCKDIDIGTKCELECEAVNKEKLIITR